MHSLQAKKVDHYSTSSHLSRSTFGPEKEPANLAIGDYDINRKLVLSMQCIGEGEAAARIICSSLGLSNGGYGRRWTAIEQSMAEEEIVLCDKMEWHLSPEALHQLNHRWNTNKCKSLMGVITRYLPKVRNYCKTICGSGRLGLAIGGDSVGKEAFFSRLYDHLGMVYNNKLKEQMRRRDRAREIQHIHQSSEEVKRKEAKKRNNMIRQLFKKSERDTNSGREYHPGIAIECQEEQRPTAKTKEEPCQHCGLLGHQTKTSKYCQKHHEYTPPKAVTHRSPREGLPLMKRGLYRKHKKRKKSHWQYIFD